LGQAGKAAGLLGPKLLTHPNHINPWREEEEEEANEESDQRGGEQPPVRKQAAAVSSLLDDSEEDNEEEEDAAMVPRRFALSRVEGSIARCSAAKEEAAFVARLLVERGLCGGHPDVEGELEAYRR